MIGHIFKITVMEEKFSFQSKLHVGQQEARRKGKERKGKERKRIILLDNFTREKERRTRIMRRRYIISPMWYG